MPIRQCKISQQNNVSKEQAVKGIDKIKFTPREVVSKRTRFG